MPAAFSRTQLHHMSKHEDNGMDHGYSTTSAPNAVTEGTAALSMQQASLQHRVVGQLQLAGLTQISC